jgi:Flp pilus assembly protein TadB
MALPILLFLQLVLLVFLILLRQIWTVYVMRALSVCALIYTIGARNIRRSSSLRDLMLELVKALEGITREAIAGRAAIRAFRKRKDILSAD